jgi:transketolase
MNPKIHFPSLKPGHFNFGPRRAVYFNIQEVLAETKFKPAPNYLANLEAVDLIYRTLCAVLYNFVPTSGHPGGSISSGRIVEGLIYSAMDYDFSAPQKEDADILVYTAGHKAMGLYAMWALRNELIRIARPEMLPEVKFQLRLEDLLGFRRNPTNDTPLFKQYQSKTLDGHPTPATPFVRLATGASGVGVPAALGMAMAALDVFGEAAPKVHLLEGEGGMTPGRVHEALAAAASACLYNAILHVDWNQASIDSNHVCREGSQPGDYTQWDPAELCYCHDWNVIFVPNGLDFHQILAAQQLALSLTTKQPTAVVYRTIKGWKYGIEGKASHGAGHKFCSEGYYKTGAEFQNYFNVQLPRFNGDLTPENIEKIYFDTLMMVRQVLEENTTLANFAAAQIVDSKQRLEKKNRGARVEAPKLPALYNSKTAIDPKVTPAELVLKPGESVTLRAVLGDALNFLNKKTGGAIIGAAADLLGSTSVANLNNGFPQGLYNAVSNPQSRLIAVGGICEDAMGAFMAGLASFGHHIGVTSSYGAFIGALEHVAARLHGIGQQTNQSVTGEPYKTWIMVNAHAGVKTGEDGPTHADPQVLQLLQENFPKGVLITLTPWDAQEIWPLLIAGLLARPAILCPFVTRPTDKIVDRTVNSLPPAHAAVKGIYAMRRADPSAKQQSGTLVLQGNGVATIFVQEVLPKLDEKGLNLNVFYVASAELFDRQSSAEQEEIFPEVLTYESMGITDFTLPTMYRWVRSNEGIRRTLHSFRGHHYLGSGQAHKVLQEAGIHAEGQLQAILDYAHNMEKHLRNGNSQLLRSALKKQIPQSRETVWLTCTNCGAKVEPLEYFGDQLPPNDEFCIECEHREAAVCANCLAYWMNANTSIKFYCKTCLAKN